MKSSIVLKFKFSSVGTNGLAGQGVALQVSLVAYSSDWRLCEGVCTLPADPRRYLQQPTMGYQGTTMERFQAKLSIIKHYQTLSITSHKLHKYQDVSTIAVQSLTKHPRPIQASEINRQHWWRLGCPPWSQQDQSRARKVKAGFGFWQSAIDWSSLPKTQRFQFKFPFGFESKLQQHFLRTLSFHQAAAFGASLSCSRCAPTRWPQSESSCTQPGHLCRKGLDVLDQSLHGGSATTNLPWFQCHNNRMVLG